MRRRRGALREIVESLSTFQGKPAPPVAVDPFEAILWENVAYLVDERRRGQAFARLREEVGLTPEAILGAPRPSLVNAIRDGGMHPEQRAAKLARAAEIACEIGQPLAQVVRLPPVDARRLLKRFPGIGDPGADKLLLLAGTQAVLALDSNGLRVIVRLGFAEERRSYSSTYRAAQAAVSPLLPRDPAWLLAAHFVLRRHGQVLCRNTRPRCADCPVASECDFTR